MRCRSVLIKPQFSQSVLYADSAREKVSDVLRMRVQQITRFGISRSNHALVHGPTGSSSSVYGIRPVIRGEDSKNKWRVHHCPGHGQAGMLIA
jgi:hypothetical protein